jgi:hypothetical protein
VLNRQLRASIRALRHGAVRIGAGDFEVAGLAATFNGMAARLQDSRVKLQHEVDARSRDLTEALEQ